MIGFSLFTRSWSLSITKRYNSSQFKSNENFGRLSVYCILVSCNCWNLSQKKIWNAVLMPMAFWYIVTLTSSYNYRNNHFSSNSFLDIYFLLSFWIYIYIYIYSLKCASHKQSSRCLKKNWFSHKLSLFFVQPTFLYFMSVCFSRTWVFFFFLNDLIQVRLKNVTSWQNVRQQSTG